MQIRILAFLLILQSFLACEQNQGNIQSLAEARVCSSSGCASQPAREKATASAEATLGFTSGDAGLLGLLQTPETATGMVFQSVDGGQSWQDVSAGLPADVEIWGLSSVGGEVFLGTNTGMFRSEANSSAPAWRQEPFLGKRVNEVFPGRNGLYARSIDDGLFQETLPGSGVWQPVYPALKDKFVHKILENPDGAILVSSNRGIFKSADNGKTWNQVFDGDVLSLVQSNGVLIGGGYKGVLRSTDAGEHWEIVLNENILAKKTGIIGDRFFAIFGTDDPWKLSPEGITNRLRISSDGGKSWQRIDGDVAPLPARGKYQMDARLSQARDIYDVEQMGQYLFCSFDTGIFRSADQGKTWEQVFPVKGEGSFNFVISGRVIYAIKGGGC